MSEITNRAVQARPGFTYEVYETLLTTALERGYSFLTIREYLTREDLPDRFVVMRHDVDRKPENALDLARIEKSAGISTSYYFRTVEETFEPRVIETIEDLGHEVGYHYEDLDRADGDVALATDYFARNLARFREHADVDTVSMHGNPLTPHDNRDMWKGNSFDEYDLLGEVYLSFDFTEVTYFSDTNRTWYDEKTIVNDWPVGSNEKHLQVRSTHELIDLVDDRRLDRLYLLAHPDRWADSYLELVNERARDEVLNAGKWGLWGLRRLLGDGAQGENDG